MCYCSETDGLNVITWADDISPCLQPPIYSLKWHILDAHQRYVGGGRGRMHRAKFKLHRNRFAFKLALPIGHFAKV